MRPVRDRAHAVPHARAYAHNIYNYHSTIVLAVEQRFGQSLANQLGWPRRAFPTCRGGVAVTSGPQRSDVAALYYNVRATACPRGKALDQARPR